MPNLSWHPESPVHEKFTEFTSALRRLSLAIDGSVRQVIVSRGLYDDLYAYVGTVDKDRFLKMINDRLASPPRGVLTIDGIAIHPEEQ